MYKRGLFLAAVVFTCLSVAVLSGPGRGEARDPEQQATPPDVFAEAVGQANLRGGPGLDYPVVGEITTGARYRVLARHSQVPWLRLDVRAVAPQQAWVFADLVSVFGPLESVPPLNDFPPVDALPPTATATLAAPDAVPGGLAAQELPPAAPPATPTALAPTPTLSGAVVTTLGPVNLRFGPGVDYAAIAELPPGASYRLLEFHALVPWVHISVPDAPGGGGWVFQDIVEISGDTSGVPYTNNLQFAAPELTPTPQTVVAAGSPWSGAPLPSGRLAQTLGVDLHNYLMENGFRPYSNRFASVFVLDLRSGDSFTLYDDVAYSGMSLTKIPILATYFQRHDGPLSEEDAYLLANTMMCSENITTNRLLEIIGDGDPYAGAQRVTGFMQALDLSGTFLVSPYTTGIEPPADATPAPAVSTIVTGADQTSAQPDPFNQMVPSDLGWLLAAMYQCAQDGTGLLMERFPGAFTVQECRQMLRAMDANEIGVFLEAGVPQGTSVMHKHGWISDTHGDAGLVVAPDAAYVFVAALYGETWLEFELSAPVMAELSRRTWNALVPQRPVTQIAERIVPAECDARSDPVYTVLRSNELLPAPGPAPAPDEATPAPADG